MALLGVATALLCSGCIAFQSPPTASQNGWLGSIHVSFKVCATQSGGGPTGSCTDKNGNSSQPATGNASQVWLGFRVPSGTVAPASFSSSATGPSNTGPQLQFSQRADYAGELQRLDPAPSGLQWIGYASQYVSYSNSSGDQNFTAAVDFGLPAQPGGAPFRGPFSYQAVVGGRQSETSLADPNQPITCGSSLITLQMNSDATQGWICVDDPPPGSSTGQLDSQVVVPFHDAGIEPGAPVTAPAGTTAAVPFTLAYVNTFSNPQGAGFTLSENTTAPGAIATSPVFAIGPTNTSSNMVNVSVRIPVSSTPGAYTVTLTGTMSDGETRSGSAVLIVAPALCVVPKLTGKKLKAARTALRAAHCTLGAVKHKHAHAKKGKIIAQSPGRGHTLANGARVAVTTSLGPKH